MSWTSNTVWNNMAGTHCIDACWTHRGTPMRCFMSQMMRQWVFREPDNASMHVESTGAPTGMCTCWEMDRSRESPPLL